MQIIQRTVVDAPADQVWEVLARRFGDISAWASAVSESASVPSPTGEPVGAGRTVRTSFGELRETLVRYDERGRSLGYRAEGLPFPVAGSTNDWSVRPRGTGPVGGRDALEL